MRMQVIIASTLMAISSAQAAEVKLFSNPAIRQTIEKIIPLFQNASGHKVDNTVALSAALKQRIEAGENFDVAIITPPSLLEDLAPTGKIVKESIASFARAGIIVTSPASAPRPDFSSVDKFKDALLKARSISFAQGSAAGTYFSELIERLGIADAVKPKLELVAAGERGKSVASGEVDLSITIETEGAQAGTVATPLPAELQHYQVYAAGASAHTSDSEASGEFIRFLSSPAAVDVIRSTGMEPVESRLK